MFKWLGRKAGSGAIDGAISRLIERITAVDFDLDKIDLISKYLSEDEREEFKKNLARLIVASVKIGAKALEKKANG